MRGGMRAVPGGNVHASAAAEGSQALTECDFIVPAADTADARHLVNAVADLTLKPQSSVPRSP